MTAPARPVEGCPSTGTLRTHLDHPSADVEAHLDDCAVCRDVTVGLAGDAGTARRLIGLLDAPDPAVGHDRGLPRPTARNAPIVPTAATRPGVRRGPRRPARSRGVAGSGGLRRSVGAALALALAVGLAVTPGGRTAVAGFLDVFRTERLQVVDVDVDAVGDLSALAALGEVTADVDEPSPTADAAEAIARSGLQPPDPDALRAALGVPDADATHLATRGGSATLTLVARDGNGVPAELDGAALHVTVPPAVATVLTQAGTAQASPLDGIPLLVAGIAGSPQIAAEGASLADVRAFLLSRDELPASLRDQLTAIDDWQHTLPIPVPSDEVEWDAVAVAGVDGLAFGDESGLGAAVVWQVDGHIRGLAGPQPRQALIDLAARVQPAGP